jgi:hypothetical protein
MSRTLLPRACIPTIFSPMPPIRARPFATIRGSKLPSRSCGTSSSNAPPSPFTVLRLAPFRRLVILPPFHRTLGRLRFELR